jgi:class 3 adenylate cyclase
VWGETVNIASRLEGHCDPGQMQISEATRHALTKDWPLRALGQVDLKGVGNISAYVITR